MLLIRIETEFLFYMTMVLVILLPIFVALIVVLPLLQNISDFEYTAHVKQKLDKDVDNDIHRV